jgi:alkylation response protein AidB-like acyl-CoA dehydrogenase
MAALAGPSAILELTHRALAFWSTYVESLERRPEGFLRTLLAGEPDWSKVVPYPRLTDSESVVVGRILESLESRRLELGSSDVDAGSLARIMRETGLAGITASVGAGGAGLSMFASTRIVAKLAESNLSAAVLLGAHAFFSVRLVEQFASPETKRSWMPRLVSGEVFAAYAVSEPDAGSDLAAITTTVLEHEGAAVVTGEKTHVSGGTIARAAVVAATGFGETEADRARPSVCWVPMNEASAGVSGGDRMSRFVGGEAGVARIANPGWAGLEALGTATLRFERAPVECLLGGAGQGNAVLKEGLAGVRLAAAAAALGSTRALLRRALEAAGAREQFGKRIVEFEMCREKLARAAIQIEAMEAVVDLSAALVDRGVDASVEAAAAKVFCTRAAEETSSALLELVGADAAAAGGRSEAGGRGPGGAGAAIPALKWVGGANDVLKLFIVLEGCRPVLEFLFRNREARKGAGRIDAVVKKWWRGLRLVHRRPALPRLGKAFREPGRIFAESAGILAERTFQVCEYHLNEIVDNQYEVRRLAEMMLEVWPLAAQLVRAESLAERAMVSEGSGREDAGKAGMLVSRIEDSELARIAVRFRARRAWRRVARWSSQVYLSDDSDVERVMERIDLSRPRTFLDETGGDEEA